MPAAAAKLVPRHVAIIMDGNGRWAAARGLPRTAGHKAGLKPVRMCIEECARRGVEALTLFAFSSENWAARRRRSAASWACSSTRSTARSTSCTRNGVRVRFIGERTSLCRAPAGPHRRGRAAHRRESRG